MLVAAFNIDVSPSHPTGQLLAWSLPIWHMQSGVLPGQAAIAFFAVFAERVRIIGLPHYSFCLSQALHLEKCLRGIAWLAQHLARGRRRRIGAASAL